MAGGPIVLVGCAPGLGQRLRAAGRSVEELPDVDAAVGRVSAASGQVAAVALGRGVASPVEAVQRLGTVDGQLAVVVLVDEGELADRTRALQFAPFIGEDVSCRSDDYLDTAASAVQGAADRTQRRREHRATMRAASDRLGSAPPLSGAAMTTQSLGSLLDQAPVGVVTLDDHARIVSVNRHAARLLEADSAALTRRPLVELFSEEVRPRLAVMLIPTSPLLPSATRRFGRERADGRVQELDITAARFESALGARGTILLLQDATDRAATERRERRQARTLQDGVIRTLTAAHEAALAGDARRAADCIGVALERSRLLASQLGGDPAGLAAAAAESQAS